MPCPEKGTNSTLGITLSAASASAVLRCRTKTGVDAAEKISNTDRFSNFCQFYNLLEICNKAVIKYSIAPKTRHYTTL